MSNIDVPGDAGFRVKGWHVGAGVAAFFAVVGAVDGLFTVLALRTHPGAVSVTPYEDGLLYNRQLARRDAQAKLGWRAAASAQRGGVGLEMRDAAGLPLTGLRVSAVLKRPATEAGAIVAQFVETAPGVYAASVAPEPGAWDLYAEARLGERTVFETERRLSWP